MSLRERIMQLAVSIDKFVIDHGLMTTDEKITFDYIMQMNPLLPYSNAKTFAKLVQRLNEDRCCQEFLVDLKSNSLDGVFEKTFQLLTDCIDHTGAAPKNTPPKIINTVLLIENFRNSAIYNDLKEANYHARPF